MEEKNYCQDNKSLREIIQEIRKRPLVNYFDVHYNEKPRNPGFRMAYYNTICYVYEEKKISNMIKEYFSSWNIGEAAYFYQEMEPSYMMIKIAGGRKLTINESADTRKLSNFNKNTTIDEITFNGINDKLDIDPKRHIENIQIKCITECEVVNYFTKRTQQKAKTYREISFESDRLNVDALGKYERYSFQELKEYLAYLSIESIIKKTQKKAEAPLSREEISELIEENYIQDGNFSSYKESKDDNEYHILYFLDKERAVVIFDHDDYSNIPKWKQNLERTVPLSSIRTGDICFHEQKSE